MSSLLGAHSLSKSFGSQLLFKQISFTISYGDRIGLIGPNGSGKSTLMQILAGIQSEDEGHISKEQGLRIGYASQSPEFPDKTLEEVLVQEIPKGDPLEVLTRARILLGKAQFDDFSQKASTLSGGWKKRLDLARALMQEPDLLLLDEPTNHLDLEGILWLEKFLSREKTAYLVISHDRYFLEKISNKIFELNRCFPQGLFISKGNMSAFVQHKTAFLEAQAEQERSLASSVRSEIDWLRRSPKARTTKSQSRVQSAHKMIEEYSEIKKRNTTTKVDIHFSASERATRRLIVGTNLAKSLGGKQLFKGVDIVLSPGTRLGIVGDNGTGKTTFLKMLAGKIPQDMGSIKYADNLQLVYFDQHRENIPPDMSLKDALSPSGDFVKYRGQEIHVHGWAKRFLFAPERLPLPVRCLSGGERARILIAKLMLEPADVLFLDEPTNDLDIPTLEVIEQSLEDFAGAVVLISHDRCLMDKVCTQILGFGKEEAPQLYSDYSQWEKASAKPASQKENKLQTPPPLPPAKKLSYLEKKELDGMSEKIEAAEKKIADLENQLKALPTSLEICNHLATAHQELETLFARWQVLEDKSKN